MSLQTYAALSMLGTTSGSHFLQPRTQAEAGEGGNAVPVCCPPSSPSAPRLKAAFAASLPGTYLVPSSSPSHW